MMSKPTLSTSLDRIVQRSPALERAHYLAIRRPSERTVAHLERSMRAYTRAVRATCK